MSLAQSMNLNSVMAHLTQMSPQQLQQFAAMHKDDPIMLAAASSVKNNKDKLAQSAQAKMSGQQPPPVNEQVVENMARHPQGGPQGMPPEAPPQEGPQASNQLPENQGIAQLPTPNMQHMAGGGIVAFADGGDTGPAGEGSDASLVYNNEPVMRMAEGGVARFQTGGQSIMRQPAGGGVMGDLPGSYVPGAVVPSQYVPDDSEMTVYERAKRALIQSNQDAEARRQGYKSLAEKEAVLGTNKNARDMLLERPQTSKIAAPSIDLATAAPAAKTGATTGAGAGNPGAGAGNPGAAQPRPQPQGGIATLAPQDYRAQMAGYMPKESVDPFATQRQELNDAATNAKQMQANRLREDIAAEGKAGEGQEARLGKREGELGKQKDLNLNLALMEAGFATMQSRGKGLAGLGEGAAVGMKAYSSGIQRLQDAQEKIDTARDNLDNLRRNETRMNNREVRAAEGAIEDTMLSGKKDAIAGAQQAYGMDRQDARSFVEMNAKAKEGALDRASRERVANMPSGQIQLLTALGGKGGVEEGLRLMTAIQAGKFSPEQAWERYVASGVGKDTTTNPMKTPQQFMAELNQIHLLSQVPKAGNAPTGQVLP